MRALTKLGIAIAANKPMMATTIMISTRVNADFFDFWIFILFAFVCIAEYAKATSEVCLSDAVPFTYRQLLFAGLGVANLEPHILSLYLRKAAQVPFQL